MNYTKTMADDVMRELEKNSKDYGLDAVLKSATRKEALAKSVKQYSGQTRSHYRELVRFLSFSVFFIHTISSWASLCSLIR